MSPVLSLGLLVLGPFVAIAFVARNGDFRASRLVVAAVIGQLLGILVWAGFYMLWTRVLVGQRNRLVVFLPPTSRSDQLVTFAFIIAYALTVAATVLLGHWAYMYVRRPH
jgi:hypothetical protein